MQNKRVRAHGLWVMLMIVGFILGNCRVVSAQSSLFGQLQSASKTEMSKTKGKLLIGMEWPAALARPVLAEFTKDNPFISDLKYRRERRVENMQRILVEVQQGKIPDYDILHISSESWDSFEKAGLFPKPPFDYKALAKSLPADWGEVDARGIDPNGYFIAAAGLARGIVYNNQIVPANQAPKEWNDCLDARWKGKFLLDPRNKLQALQHDPKTREFILKWMKGTVANGAVLNRGQTENLQKVAGGEFPLFCGVNYHSAMPLIDKGAPLGFILPDPVPLEFGTQIHVLKWSKTPATTQLLILWMASKGQEVIEQKGYRGMPWSPKSRKFQMAKGKYIAICDADCVNRSEQYEKEYADILNLPGVR